MCVACIFFDIAIHISNVYIYIYIMLYLVSSQFKLKFQMDGKALMASIFAIKQ